MRGLPETPRDVLEIRWRWTVGDSDASSTTSYYIAGASLLTRDAVIDVCDAIAFDMLDLYSRVTTVDASLADYEATLHGTDFVRVIKPLTPSHGEWPGTGFVNTACAIYWLTERAGRRGHAMTFFPTFPADFTNDGRTLNANGFDTVRDAAFTYLDRVIATPVPEGLAVVPVLVSKVQSEAPRDRAVVFPVVGAVPVRHVGDMGRRLRLSRRIQSV